MNNHTVKAFDEELAILARSINEMGGIAESMLTDALDALVHRDQVKAQAVVKRDSAIDVLQSEIEERAFLVVAKRQPMANDLRTIMGTIRIAADIERIGDLLKNIGKRVGAMDNGFMGLRTLSGISHMADIVHGQVKLVLDSYAQNRPELAHEVWLNDGTVDQLHNALFRELLTYMMEDPRSITFCAHLLFIAKNIERVGDHATNIAETVYFIETGKVLAGERPRGDGSTYRAEPQG
jgi:phosphate transport system protein